jgi:hypothetical protein
LPDTPSQQICASPPHDLQTSFWQRVKAAVHLTSPPQQGCPALPHVLDWQPPAAQVPCPPEQVVPAATQVG